MRFVHNLLYKLKRQYGAKVTLYKTLTSDVNPQTGKRTTTRKVVPITLAIVLPDTLARKFAYEHSFLAANRPFTYGAQWDQGQRIVIVDGNDIPKDFTIEVETSLVFENTRYTVKTANRMDVGFGYLLTIVRAENNTPLQILDFNISHALCMGQSSAGTL
jgi:hypothetical protein